MSEHASFIGTNSFWAFVAFVIFFFILAYLKIHHKFAQALDARAEGIAKELDEARRLREEAQELVAEYEKKRQQAEKEAQEILSKAKREAEALAKEAKEKSAAYIERRRLMAEQKIRSAEQTALDNLRQKAVDIAAATVEKILAEDLSAEDAKKAFQSSVQQLRESLPS